MHPLSIENNNRWNKNPQLTHGECNPPRTYIRSSVPFESMEKTSINRKFAAQFRATLHSSNFDPLSQQNHNLNYNNWFPNGFGWGAALFQMFIGVPRRACVTVRSRKVQRVTSLHSALENQWWWRCGKLPDLEVVDFKHRLFVEVWEWSFLIGLSTCIYLFEIIRRNGGSNIFILFADAGWKDKT